MELIPAEVSIVYKRTKKLEQTVGSASGLFGIGLGLSTDANTSTMAT
jgi:hypothetical protein